MRETAEALEANALATTPSSTRSSERFNQWVRRSAADLRMLVSATPHGDYPYAGVPWFSTPFGRDGIITALQTLWINPASPAACSRISPPRRPTSVDASAGCRARQDSPRDAQQRDGAARRGAVRPLLRQRRCHAAVRDARGRLLRADRRRAFLGSMWPHVERALDWIDRYGDRDGDGFVEYARRSPNGLVQQGWKDSQDSVFHEDGSLADAPIALCRSAGLRLRRATACGARWPRRSAERAARSALRAQADQLRDGVRRPVLVRGAVAPMRWRSTARSVPAACARRTPGTACSAASRRPSARAAVARRPRRRRDVLGLGHPHGRARPSSRYNPMSYHNGSVWPHDNGADRRGPLALSASTISITAPFACALRCQRHDGRPAPAGAVLRFPPTRRRGSDAVSGGVFAAGVGVRRRVSASCRPVCGCRWT